MTRWADVGADAAEYADRFAALASSGTDVHGEARFCEALAPVGASVLDAGCGTGRVAIELARRGRECVGVDVDAAMLAQARRLAPELEWVEHDLATLDLERTFDLVVAAGNVIPLLTAGTEAIVVERLSAHVRPGGSLVAGFGLDGAHLPLPEPPFGLDDYDDWCSQAGLRLVERFATWDRAPYHGGAYAVSVHRV